MELELNFEIVEEIHLIEIDAPIEPIKSEIEEYLADALDKASLNDDFDILVW
jgi:hypothetical protein